MRFNHDPLVPRQRRKKAGETPDETEQRLNADLQALMNDERYQKNDGEFRHFVQRQFRRVYDDPSGKRSKNLIIGRPKTYVTDLEPFERAREQLLRRKAQARESDGATVKKPTTGDEAIGVQGRRSATASTTHLGAAGARPVQTSVGNDITSTEEHDIPPYWDRAIGRFDPQPRTRSTPFPGIRDVEDEEAQQRYQDYLDDRRQGKRQVPDAQLRSWAFIKIERLAGHDEAARAHEHYLEGSGEPLVVDARIVRDYGPVDDAEVKTLGYLADWFAGRRSDSQFGSPLSDLEDGERIVVGNMSVDPNDIGGLARWDAGFVGPTENYHPGDENSEARRTFNAGTLESFSQLVLERQGNLVNISGIVKFRVFDRYDFKRDHLLKSKVLEDYGDAKSFVISTTLWVRPISGWMIIGKAPVPRVHLTFDD